MNQGTDSPELTRRVAVYARVSTSDQTVENQLQALRELANRKGWDVYGEYVDNVVSGTKRHRPEFDRMLRDAKGNRFKVILVAKLDRLGRSFFHLFQVVDELNSMKIDIVTADGRVDTSTVAGKTFFVISSLFAEIERDLIAERTKSGLARARASGKRLGRPPQNIDLNRVAQLRAQKWGWRRIGKELGISYQTVRSHTLRKRVSDAPREETAESGG